VRRNVSAQSVVAVNACKHLTLWLLVWISLNFDLLWTLFHQMQVLIPLVFQILNHGEVLIHPIDPNVSWIDNIEKQKLD
jgi:hypothetical protein